MGDGFSYMIDKQMIACKILRKENLTIPVNEHFCTLAVCSEEDCLKVYLLLGITGSFLDCFQQL